MVRSGTDPEFKRTDYTLLVLQENWFYVAHSREKNGFTQFGSH